jgi:hypothetical protein
VTYLGGCCTKDCSCYMGLIPVVDWSNPAAGQMGDVFWVVVLQIIIVMRLIVGSLAEVRSNPAAGQTGDVFWVVEY